MTPLQESFVAILESAGKRALGDDAIGVFVVVAATSGDLKILWEADGRGAARIALIGLVDLGLDALRKQTMEGWTVPAGQKDAPVLRLVPPVDEPPRPG